MAMNYNAKKKADLESLLKERGLAHTGNKPDLVARLQEDDAKQGGTDAGAEAAAAAPSRDEDKIDWGEDDVSPASSNLEAVEAAQTPASKAALGAGGVGRVENPVNVPNQLIDEANEPGKTTNTIVSPPAPADTIGLSEAREESAEDAEAKKKAYEEKFKADLAASEADKEADKRKKRAERFGQQVGDEEAQKQEERAKRFGTSVEDNDRLIKMLDGALPERKERKRGRDRTDIGRGGINKRIDSRKRDNRPRGPRQGKSSIEDADRVAREGRAARFAR